MHATKPPTASPKLLPHLAGFMDGPAAPSPWVFGPTKDRKKLMNRHLPRWVQTVFIGECARVVLPVWESLASGTDRRPHEAIDTAIAHALNPTNAAYAAEAAGAADAAYAAYAADAAYAAGAAEAARAAGAAEAAGAAGAADAAYAAYAARAAGAAEAAGAAGAADAAYAADAADAAQWRWTHAAFRAACSPPWQTAWNTGAVVSLAQFIFDGLAFDRLPILADALQDAGCDDGSLLTRLRDPFGTFTRADCALWQPLGIGRHAE